MRATLLVVRELRAAAMQYRTRGGCAFGQISGTGRTAEINRGYLKQHEEDLSANAPSNLSPVELGPLLELDRKLQTDGKMRHRQISPSLADSQVANRHNMPAAL